MNRALSHQVFSILLVVAVSLLYAASSYKLPESKKQPANENLLHVLLNERTCKFLMSFLARFFPRFLTLNSPLQLTAFLGGLFRILGCKKLFFCSLQQKMKNYSTFFGRHCAISYQISYFYSNLTK